MEMQIPCGTPKYSCFNFCVKLETRKNSRAATPQRRGAGLADTTIVIGDDVMAMAREKAGIAVIIAGEYAGRAIDDDAGLGLTLRVPEMAAQDHAILTSDGNGFVLNGNRGRKRARHGRRR